MQDSDTTTHAVPARVMTRRVVTAALGVITTMALVGAAPSSAESSAVTATCTSTSTTTDWKPAATRASTALAHALAHISSTHYNKAVKNLRVMKHQTLIAHSAATALIGRPPTDPESDDPPGVQAVLKVNALEHKVTLALVPLFSDPNGQHVGAPLARGLLTADKCRDAMLDKVIALRPAKRDDYTDGLSDTLPDYSKELTAMSTQLAGDDLTSGGRSALTQAHQVVSTTQAAMKKAFGGGERTPRGR
jgi:hypothetical protein